MPSFSDQKNFLLKELDNPGEKQKLNKVSFIQHLST